ERSSEDACRPAYCRAQSVSLVSVVSTIKRDFLVPSHMSTDQSPDRSTQILLVEDEDIVLRLMARWLKEEGHDVATCSRYEDARRYLATETPAALITDVRLGAYNGLQLAMLVHDRRPDVPILVLSAFEDPQLKDETARLGAMFVMKPLLRE